MLSGNCYLIEEILSIFFFELKYVKFFVSFIIFIEKVTSILIFPAKHDPRVCIV